MPTKINNESPIELTADQMEQGSAALGGAAKGAMLGAKLGTIVPGVGNVVGAVAGGLIGGVGGLVKTRKQQQEEELTQQPEYTTNIDPMTGQEIPLTMTGKQKPLKALTQMQGTTAHNMSAAQYRSALKMKEISGAATMMTRDEKIAQINAIPGMPENVKENMRSAATVVGDVKKYSTIDEAPKPPAYSAKKQKLKPTSELSKFEKAKIFNKYAMETGLSPNFDSIRATDTTENKTMATDAMKKFYSNPANVSMMNKEKEKYFKNK